MLRRARPNAAAEQSATENEETATISTKSNTTTTKIVGGRRDDEAGGRTHETRTTTTSTFSRLVLVLLLLLLLLLLSSSSSSSWWWRWWSRRRRRPSGRTDPTFVVECALSTPFVVAADHDVADGALRFRARPDLAPRSVEAFAELVRSGHFDGAFVFRAVPGFVVQWGFRPDRPRPPPRGEQRDARAPGKSLSHTRGTLAFAGGTRTQVFVNLSDQNRRLDLEDGEPPFATLDEESMAIVDRIYTGYKGGQGQIPAVRKGAEAVKIKFPRMSRIDRCRVLGEEYH